MSDELGLIFSRHLRVKVLKEAGTGWGTRVVTLYTRDRQERIDGIEGITYTLGSDSSIIATEMGESAIFIEKGDADWTRCRFTLPSVHPGCILDIRYRITSTSLFDTRDWEFQTTVPTLWSEFRFIAPRFFTFGGLLSGAATYIVNEQRTMDRHFGGEAAAYMGGPVAACRQHRWAVKDAPALGDEPFVPNMHDYTPGVTMQLAGYALPKGGSKRVLRTWPEVVRELLRHENFGEKCRSSGPVEQKARELCAGLTAAGSKVRTLYDYVKDNVVWDGRYSIFAERTNDEVLEFRRGNNAEMAFLLTALLRASGAEAAPVLVSTRPNGRVRRGYPLLSQFNDVLVRVVEGERTWLLDPTDPLRPAGLLAPSVLNVSGLAVTESKEQWIEIRTTKKYMHHSTAELVLDPGGEIRGVLECRDEEYAALETKQRMRGKTAAEAAAEIFNTGTTGLMIDSAEAPMRDDAAGPAQLTAHVRSTGPVQRAGELLYLDPQVIDRITSNPFPEGTRRFPVDMSYPRENLTEITITIPEGYDVLEAPPDVSLDIGNGDAVFVRRVFIDGGHIRVQENCATARAEFPPSQYARLRELFGEIVSAESDQFVFQRSARRASLTDSQSGQ
jgi:hypothetical protein